MSDLKSRINQLSDSYFTEAVALRRQLHSWPELSFQEEKTSGILAGNLKKAGIEFKSGFVKTGIVAQLRGKNPGRKVVALRADMDALPITEELEVEWKSKRDGIMHACGHDIHMACLMGTAWILKDLIKDLDGTILLIFQPGEELIPGGAKLMLEEGALDDPRPDMVLGLHVQPDIPVGMVGFKPGSYMASNDEVHLKVIGKGRHAALPGDGTDTVFSASQITVDLKRTFQELSVKHPETILSFGKVKADGATNVIPGEVRIEGTFRAMNADWRKEAHDLIRAIAKQTAEKNGVKCLVDIREGYPPLVNDEKLTRVAINYSVDYLGKDMVQELETRMTSEDFAFYSQVFPSCFFRLGVRGKSWPGNLHTSTFFPEESAIKTGMGIMSYLACSLLKSS